MNALRPLAQLLLGTTLVALSGLALNGCVSAPPVAERHELLPAGSVTVFHRRSSGSYGVADGPVTWVHERMTWQGRAVIAARSDGAGTSLLDPQTYGLVAQLDAAGQTVYTLDPPWGHPWPMTVGRQWTTQHTLVPARGGKSLPLETTWTVEARETITVPAGTFTTWRVRSVDSMGETQLVWSCPEQGLNIVKRILDRDASSPRGAGHLEGELVSLQRGR